MPEKGASRHMRGEVDIDRANAEELAMVSDIGEQRARKIIEYRNRNGAFRSVDDLVKVEGFGDTLKDDLREALSVGGGASAEPIGRASNPSQA